MTKYVLAHDLGTTGNKASLYDADGWLVGSALYTYGTEFAQNGWAEQDPHDWWAAVCGSTQQLLRDAGVRGADVACIVFSGQMMGAVALDAQARPLRKAIIWADTRSVAQVNVIADHISPEDVYRISGHRLSPSYSLAKILWIKQHQPDIYRAAHKFVHAKDSMVARLTGRFVTEPSDASGMNLYDLNTNTWSAAIVAAAGLDIDKLPEIVPSTAIVGGVLASVADEIGLPAGTPVVAGGGDGSCAAVGAGVVAEGTAYNYVGSSSWIAIATPRPIYDPQLQTFTFAHLVPGMYMPTGTMQAAGASYQWTRDQLCALEVEAAQSLKISPYELMNLSADKAPPGAGGLLFLPYLLGERSPRWNPRARGAFIGLTIRHTRADLVRSVLEGITFNLKVILDAFLAQSAQIGTMRLIGGGARGRFWNQMMANIYGMPVQRLSVLEEATSMGAAVAGGVGVGLYPDWSIIEQMNQPAATIMPEADAVAHYARVYPVFEAAYHALAPIYDQLAAL